MWLWNIYQQSFAVGYIFSMANDASIHWLHWKELLQIKENHYTLKHHLAYVHASYLFVCSWIQLIDRSKSRDLPTFQPSLRRRAQPLPWPQPSASPPSIVLRNENLDIWILVTTVYASSEVCLLCFKTCFRSFTICCLRQKTQSSSRSIGHLPKGTSYKQHRQLPQAPSSPNPIEYALPAKVMWCMDSSI